MRIPSWVSLLPYIFGTAIVLFVGAKIYGAWRDRVIEPYQKEIAALELKIAVDAKVVENRIEASRLEVERRQREKQNDLDDRIKALDIERAAIRADRDDFAERLRLAYSENRRQASLCRARVREAGSDSVAVPASSAEPGGDQEDRSTLSADRAAAVEVAELRSRLSEVNEAYLFLREAARRGNCPGLTEESK